MGIDDMSELFQTALKQAMELTATNIENLQDFFEDNQKRFRMVLSHAKTDALQKNISQAFYTAFTYKEKRTPSVYNTNSAAVSEQFEALPESVQLLRLRKLNQTIHNALNGDKTPIHIKCRNVEKGFKDFHKTKDGSSKEKELIRASDELTNIDASTSDNTVLKFSLGLC